MSEEKPVNKSQIALNEEKILKFWKENKIFEKSLEKNLSKGSSSAKATADKEFVFYEGPPTANGRPGIHHLESRSFKDLILRFKTMQGYYVRRKGGWDTHGLPVELEVEKQLGLKSKKEIEEYGIAEFNEKCKESVWRYIDEWRRFTERIGYWLDLDCPFITYKPYYIESLWNIIKKVDQKNLLYKDYKVLPWCPRCQTALSSHELAQGYRDVKDLSVYVKFKLNADSTRKLCGTDAENIYLLAWTTTPWTLPGNVALAVNPKINYVLVEADDELYIVAEDLAEKIFHNYSKFKIQNSKFRGSELVGLEYEPLYPFLKENLPESEKEKLKNAFKVYPAYFVTTEDGTGIVHTAVMYGQEDFDLGTKVHLPKYHLVNENGTFKKEADFLAGKFVKDPETDVLIIKDLAHREPHKLLFHKEKHEHSYPHCWRCKTPLIYFARNSWYIRMSELREKLVRENESINWEPSYIKEGRFGEWLSEVKDWAISRERYWGTPLPIWECFACDKRQVAGSFEEIFLQSKDKVLTRLILLRHGESEKNMGDGFFDSSLDTFPLTSLGKKMAEKAGKELQDKNISAIYYSPVWRTRETAEIISKHIGKKPIEDDRLWEARSGEWDGKKVSDPSIHESRVSYNQLSNEEYYQAPRGKSGESWEEVEKRMADFVQDIIEKHKGESIVLVSHEGPLIFLLRFFKNLSLEEVTSLWDERRFFHRGILGEYAEPTYVYADNKTGKEIDPHRPRIDEIKLSCKCGGDMERVKEVADVWFDSGAMPFAQDHYPFKNKEKLDDKGFPADFISEALDQTRGWFYTLHAIGILMDKGKAYKNVICLGLLLDKEGKKMSKSVGNVINPWEAADKYGIDVIRFWMYSINQPGENKNFDEKTLEEVSKKVVNPLMNVLAFYNLFIDRDFQIKKEMPKSENVLDKWILSYLSKLTFNVTKNLDSYQVLNSARDIRSFITDLSQWYVRRSRDRFKAENGRDEAMSVLGFILIELSKMIAPFMPFLAERIYQELKVEDKSESVHLCDWPSAGKVDEKIIKDMEIVRQIASMALEARSREGIKVRQPLGKLSLKDENLKYLEDLLKIIEDEVNVEMIVFDSGQKENVQLDTNITPELKKKGDLREFIRQIQDLRKKANLTPTEEINVKVETDKSGEDFVREFENEIYKSAKVKFSFEKVKEGEDIAIGELQFRLGLLMIND